MKRIICLLLALIALTGCCIAEENQCAYVMVKLLNGRARPSKKSFQEARFDYGDSLEETGEWSADHNWIEVYGGETGTVWVHINYISERKKVFTVMNENYKQVKIRKSPVSGKITGYLKKGKELEIDSVVMGWGHCSKGWIDLYYVEEVSGDD